MPTQKNIYVPVISSCELPLIICPVPAGFPSPADDYVENRLDLNQHLIKHPAATFFMRATGESMIQSGINSGDILVVDKAVEPKNNHIVVAVINGEFTVKRLKKIDNEWYLCPENPEFKPLKIDSEMAVEIWGVVTFVIHSTQTTNLFQDL